jgi:hypothetical protein
MAEIAGRLILILVDCEASVLERQGKFDGRTGARDQRSNLRRERTQPSRRSIK